MQTPSTLSIWLSEQAGPLAAIVLTIALVLIVLAASARRRRTRMNAARSGQSEETFVARLSTYDFDTGIARATYRYLRSVQGVSFPIQIFDLLDEDLGLDSDDVEETVRDLLAATNRLLQPGLRHTPIVTVEDLVRFVQASPRAAISSDWMAA